jgi:hypothetical protein
MIDPNWLEFPGAVTVCDRAGIILHMNDGAAEAYRDLGGRGLIGKNLLDCHPEPSRSKVARLLETGESNVYSIEKGGKMKFIFQAPWYRGGERAGMVELALERPRRMPHFNRDRP